MKNDIMTRQVSKMNDFEKKALEAILIDCVEGGASVSFIFPMEQEKASRFWSEVATEVDAGNRILIIAENMQGEILGTVQVILDLPENQNHRADIAKMLVHRKARRSGVGQKLLIEAENAARKEKKFLLVLDTVTGSPAERMYVKNGWNICGEIPDYAVWPNGELCSTTVLYKKLKQ